MSPLKPYPILFLGTPEFAKIPLQELQKSELFNVKAVITQPDKPSGRGHKLQAPPIKVLASELNIPYLQPSSLKNLKLNSSGLLESSKDDNKDFINQLNNLAPFKAAIVVAYGKIIPDSLLEFPSFGSINIHPSLLPKHRGAAPIQRALFSGKTITGTSIMQLDSGLDTGPVFAQKTLEIKAEENYQELEQRLSSLSSTLLLETLPDIFENKLSAKKQDDSLATYAEKWLTGEDCLIDWSEPAQKTALRIRASSPRPGARCFLSGEQVKIFKSKAIDLDALNSLMNTLSPLSLEEISKKTPGELAFLGKKELIVCCKENSFLKIEQIQLPGKKIMQAADLINSGKINTNSKFSNLDL